MSLRTAPEPRRKKPIWQRRERDFIRRTPLLPTVRFSRWMDGGRHDDHTAIASKIEPGGKAGSVFYLESGVLEVDVAASTAGGRFDRGNAAFFSASRISDSSPPWLGSTSRTTMPEIAPLTTATLANGQRTKTLAAPNDPVKRGARQPSPQTDSFEPAAHLGLGRMSLARAIRW